MKNVYISTSVHVRRLSGQTKQEKFPNIQPTFFVRILEPIWASFFDVDILQRLSIKVKRTLRSVFSLCYTTYIFTRVYCVQRRSRTAAYYSSRFFSRVYVSLWMPYIFTVLTPSWTDWLAHLTSISCDSFYRSGTAWYLFCASLDKTTNNLCFILSRGGYPFFLVDFVVPFHLGFFSRKGSDN